MGDQSDKQDQRGVVMETAIFISYETADAAGKLWMRHAKDAHSYTVCRKIKRGQMLGYWVMVRAWSKDSESAGPITDNILKIIMERAAK